MSPQHPAPRLRSAIRPAPWGLLLPWQPPRAQVPPPRWRDGSLSERPGPVWCHMEVGRAGGCVGPGGGCKKAQCQAEGPALTPLRERDAPLGHR